MTITVVVGKNGAGKDMAAIEFGVVPAWRRGRMVAANCSLYPEELGLDPSLYFPLNEPLVELPRLGKHMKRLCVECRGRAHPDADSCRLCGGELVDVPRMHPDGGLWSVTGNQGCGLLISDVTAAFPSRETMGLPAELGQTLQQLRKPDIAPVFITCPAWARVDLMLRECVTTVIESQPFDPLWWWPFRSERYVTPPATPWGWPVHRAFKRYFYDAESYERADSTGRWDLVEPQTFGLFNRAYRSTWKRKDVALYQRAYDTSEDIDLADHIACPECGGRLPRSSCKDPEGHRAHARANRGRRFIESYPLPELMPAELLELAVPDEDDEREAELMERWVSGPVPSWQGPS